MKGRKEEHMQRCPRFSIIVPIYKVEAYLAECIESILNQSFGDFELILVDDGSPDGCGAICDAYQARDSRIQVIHKQNGGLVSARKAGTRQTRAQYILNVDGDDRMEAGALERIDAVLQEHHDPDMLSFGYKRISEQGKEIDCIHDLATEGEYSNTAGNIDSLRAGFFFKESKNRNERTTGMMNSICLKAIRRALVAPLQEAVPDGIRNGEDAAVVIPTAYRCSSIVVLHDALYGYRMRESSLVHGFQSDKMERLTDLVAYLRSAAPELPEENLICLTFMQIEGYLVQAAQACRRYSDFRQAAEKCLNSGVHGALDAYKASDGMKASHRFRVWFTKRKWFWMYWLIYHKGHV